MGLPRGDPEIKSRTGHNKLREAPLTIGEIMLEHNIQAGNPFAQLYCGQREKKQGMCLQEVG